MMDRRGLLRLGLAATAWVVASGHTPYRQWTVYRQRHLVIGTCRADAPTYPLGKKIAATLATYLPESEARVSRAPDQWRLASLISTEQMQVILLSRADAAGLVAGDAPFADFGGLPLAALFAFGDYLLVSRPDFPRRHAYLVAQTLAEHATEIPGAQPVTAAGNTVPTHPGALAYIQGQPLPPHVTEPEPGSDEHDHMQ
jgi:TRAP-type uncharacterized transport system substrate-binding protein